MATKAKGRAGAPAYYRPKLDQAKCVKLTQLGWDILRAAAKRTGRSEGDVIDCLLRRHGAAVTFVEQPTDEELVRA